MNSNKASINSNKVNMNSKIDRHSMNLIIYSFYMIVSNNII